MPFSTWLAFASIALAAAFSPGPGVLLAISTASAAGARRTVFSSAGNVVGIFLLAGLTVAGLGLLLKASPLLFLLFRGAGAVYLVYLGVRQWRIAAAASVTLPAAGPALDSRLGAFQRGLLVAVTNPKAVLFLTAVYPQFMPPGEFAPLRFFLLTFTFMASAAVSHLSYVTLSSVLLKRARMQLIHRIGGTVFIALGLALLAFS
ncbi:MAG TPA: LysE family transporter [Telluria sp.]|nr:LysE family transporter [Telluria sp.]